MDKRKYIHFVIMFLITIIISRLAPFGQVTEQGMKVLAIFIAVLYGWITIDLVWPSVYGFVCLGFTGIFTITGAFSAGFGNQQLVTILITMVFAGALNEAGLTDFLANWILKRKTFRKSPWLLLGGIFCGAVLGGLLGAGMAMIFLFWALIIKIAQECNVDKKDPIITFSILMIVLCSMNAGSIFPFHAGYLIYAGFLGTPIPTVPSLLYGTLAFLLTPLAFFFVAKVIFRLDASKFVLSDVMVAELESKRSTKGERITLYVLLAYIALLLLPEFIPDAPGMAMLKAIGVCGMSAIGLLVLNFIRVEGKPLINLTQTFVRQTQWPLILLLAVTFPLADAMKNPDSGIMATISTILTPLVSDMGLIPFMILSIILVGCLTQITHNIVLGAMFIPVLCPLCEQLGGNAFVLWYMLYVTLNCAFVTPAASMQSAMVHGHEAVTKKYAYIFGIMVLVLNWIILTLLIPVGASLFS